MLIPNRSVRTLQGTAAAIAAAVLFAGCAEPPVSVVPEDSYPFQIVVSVRSDASRTYYTARIHNQSALGEPNAIFRVHLADRGFVKATESAVTGVIAAGEAREVTVSFDRSIPYGCYGWDVFATDGRKEAWDNCGT